MHIFGSFNRFYSKLFTEELSFCISELLQKNANEVTDSELQKQIITLLDLTTTETLLELTADPGAKNKLIEEITSTQLQTQPESSKQISNLDEILREQFERTLLSLV